MTQLKIFIGSSSERKEIAQCIQEMILDVDKSIEVLGWWREDVFKSGDTHIESLFDAISRTNTAILVFAEDDRVEKKGKNDWATRDNILLEYGMFAAAHGRSKAVLVKVGNPTIPSDLSGVNYISLEECTSNIEFREKNRSRIRSWVETIRTSQTNTPQTPETALPRLYQAMLAILGAAKNSNPDLALQMDYMAAELVTAMAVSFQTGNLGVNDALAEQVVRYYLNECISISAYEATGPASWVSPTVFRYLSSQIRQYLWANIVDGKWNLRVYDWLGAAIGRAIDNAQKRLKSPSLTIFDNSSEFHWEIGTPYLQYSRVLLWTEEELAHPIAESVIAIHEAFNIPLFFVKADPNRQDKDFAFLVFERRDGITTGLYGTRKQNYHTQPFNRGIPGLGNAMEQYQTLLEREDLMFAVDARVLLLP